MLRALPAAILVAACGSTIATPTGGSGGGGGGGAPPTGGSGGAPECMPGETVACYEGPQGTEGVGTCAAGSRACSSDGTFGACEGQVLPSADACGTPADEDCDGVTTACPPWWLTWGNDEPLAGAATNQPRSLEIDSLANVYVMGRYDAALDFGALPVADPGPQGVLVAKIGSTGTAEWVQPIVSPSGGAYAGGLALHDASARLAVTGTYLSDVVIAGQTYPGWSPNQPSVESFLASLDLSGAPAWTDTFAQDGTQSAFDVAFDPGGDVYLAGDTGTQSNFGGGPIPTGVLLARFDGTGQHVASAGYPNGFGWLVAAASDGTTFVAGSSWGLPVSFGNGVDVSGGPQEDAFLVALDASGAALWGRTLGGVGNQRVTALTVDAQGDVFVAVAWDGEPDLGAGMVPFSATTSGWIGRYALGDGSLLWGRVLGGAHPEGIAATGTRVYAAGWFTDTLDLGVDGTHLAAGGEDLFLARLDVDTGADAGTAVIGTPGDERALAVVPGPTGIFVSGTWTSEALDLGAGAFDPALSANVKSFVSWSPL